MAGDFNVKSRHVKDEEFVLSNAAWIIKHTGDKQILYFLFKVGHNTFLMKKLLAKF